MKTKFSENKLIEDPEYPFKNDYTDRYEKIAQSLTEVINIESKKHPLVLSIDAPWGLGKTSFIDMWGQKLINNSDDFIVIKFDAWKNDYSDFPLQTIMSELLGQLKEFKEIKNIDNLKKKGVALCKAFVPAAGRLIIGIAAEHLRLKEAGAEFLNDIEEALVGSIEKRLTEYENHKNILSEFKEYLSEICQDKTLYLFVDELDRCRPTFAISVLEVVKHFFDVKNLCCIISTNIDALSMSIGKAYGYDSTQAKAYLERFVDIPIKLPEPDHKKFIKYMLEKEIFPDLDAVLKERIIWLIESCCSEINNLREIEKYLRDVRIFLENIKFTNSIPHIYYMPILYKIFTKRSNTETLRIPEALMQDKSFSWCHKLYESSASQQDLIVKMEELSREIEMLSKNTLSLPEESKKLRELLDIQVAVDKCYGKINRIQDRSGKPLKKTLNNFVNYFEIGKQITDLIKLIE